MPRRQTHTTTARVYRGTPRNIAMLARVLQRGGLVAVPTETVYGLAGDALSRRACAAIFRAKGRPSNDPLIAHVHDLAQLDRLAHGNEAVDLLARAFWPGPLTLVLPKKPVVPAIATSGLPSIAIRMPAHPLFRALLKKCGRPLVAPSANPFGYVSPTSAAHVRDETEGLGKKIRHILDGGPCAIGLESTIIDLRNPWYPVILRPGAISAKQIERVLGVPVLQKQKPASPATSKTNAHAKLAPGMLAKHYSPRTPVVLHETITPQSIANIPPTDAVVCISKPKGIAAISTGSGKNKNIFWLSQRGELRLAAKNLFATLRRLDGAGRWKKIHAELAPPGSEMSDAINDRLTRAAAK